MRCQRRRRIDLWLKTTPAGSCPCRRRGTGYVSRVLDQLPAGKPLFGHHRLPLCDAGAIFLSRRQASQHAPICGADPGLPARLPSLVAEPGKKPAGFRRLAAKAGQLRLPGGDLRHRNDRPPSLQLWPQQRPSDHHLRDSEPFALLGGPGGAGAGRGSNPDFPGDVLWLLCWRVHRRDGGRLEPTRRQGHIKPQPAHGQFCSWQLGLCDSRAIGLGARRDAGRQMVQRLRRIRRRSRPIF